MESLNRCISRIEKKQPEQLAELQTDFDLQDIIVLNLERAVQLMVDIGLHILSDRISSRPESMANVFTELEKHGLIDKTLAENLTKAVGFRNIAVHEYKSLNWDIVWSIITKNILDFKLFNKAVLRFMDNQ